MNGFKVLSGYSYLSSPLSPLSIASGKSDLSRSCVMVGDPRQSVESRLITVEILGLDFASGREMLPGVLAVDRLGPDSPACCSRCSSSSINPCLARGAGSIPLRVKRSAREAKQRSAPSATCNDKQKLLPVRISKRHLGYIAHPDQCWTGHPNFFSFY